MHLMFLTVPITNEILTRQEWFYVIGSSLSCTGDLFNWTRSRILQYYKYASATTLEHVSETRNGAWGDGNIGAFLNSWIEKTPNFNLEPFRTPQNIFNHQNTTRILHFPSKYLTYLWVDCPVWTIKPVLNSLTEALLPNTTVLFCSYSIASLFAVILVSWSLHFPLRDSLIEMGESIFSFRQMPCKSQTFKENINFIHKPLSAVSWGLVPIRKHGLGPPILHITGKQPWAGGYPVLISFAEIIHNSGEGLPTSSEDIFPPSLSQRKSGSCIFGLCHTCHKISCSF